MVSGPRESCTDCSKSRKNSAGTRNSACSCNIDISSSDSSISDMPVCTRSRLLVVERSRVRCLDTAVKGGRAGPADVVISTLWGARLRLVCVDMSERIDGTYRNVTEQRITSTNKIYMNMSSNF